MQNSDRKRPRLSTLSAVLLLASVLLATPPCFGQGGYFTEREDEPVFERCADQWYGIKLTRR